jgi:hypothetical protein
VLLHYHPFGDAIHAYVTGIFAAGLPYREIAVAGYSYNLTFTDPIRRLPTYKRLDLKLQFNQDVRGHRYLTRYDVYAEITNVVNFFSWFGNTREGAWTNVREYYWDAGLNRYSSDLGMYTLNIGARFGFKL